MNVKILAFALSSTFAFGIFATEYAVPEDGTLDEVIGKAANKDDELSKARIEATETAIKRFGQKAAPAPVAKPVEAPKAAATPATTNAVKKVAK